MFGDIGLLYNNVLYRACLLKTEMGYEVFFSCGNRKRFFLGRMQGKTIQNIKIIGKRGFLSKKQMISETIYKYTLMERIIFSKIKKLFRRKNESK